MPWMLSYSPLEMKSLISWVVVAGSQPVCDAVRVRDDLDVRVLGERLLEARCRGRCRPGGRRCRACSRRCPCRPAARTATWRRARRTRPGCCTGCRSSGSVTYGVDRDGHDAGRLRLVERRVEGVGIVRVEDDRVDVRRRSGRGCPAAGRPRPCCGGWWSARRPGRRRAPRPWPCRPAPRGSRCRRRRRSSSRSCTSPPRSAAPRWRRARRRAAVARRGLARGARGSGRPPLARSRDDRDGRQADEPLGPGRSFSIMCAPPRRMTRSSTAPTVARWNDDRPAHAGLCCALCRRHLLARDRLAIVRSRMMARAIRRACSR